MLRNFSFLALFCALSLIATSAQAMKDGKYSCTIYPKGADKTPIALGFELKNEEIACVKGEPGDYCEEWFTYSPKDQSQFWLDGLYDGGFGNTEEGNWEVFADSDGCNIGRLTLYKDSNFTKGFITTEYRCGSGDTEKYAGKVFCQQK